FSGGNSYHGQTNVEQGVLNVRNPTALGSSTGKTVVTTGAALEMQGDVVGETVELNGPGIQFNGHGTGALRNVSGNNTFTGTLVLTPSATIGVDSNQTLTIGSKVGLVSPTIGKITGGGDVTKELTGTLILNSANNYTGQTDIIAGVVRVENPL